VIKWVRVDVAVAFCVVWLGADVRLTLGRMLDDSGPSSPLGGVPLSIVFVGPVLGVALLVGGAIAIAAGRERGGTRSVKAAGACFVVWAIAVAMLLLAS
jgi:hypothetical protein